MATLTYDVVIIGAGTAGLSVGGILATKEHKRVLVVEREGLIGGRLASFVGKKDSVSILDRELDVRGFEDVLRTINTWVVKSQPALPALMARGFLDGYTFEAGVHVTFWDNKGRLSCLLNYLGKHVDLPGNEGYVVLDTRDDKWHQVEKGASYEWMTDEAYQETRRLLREMANFSMKEADKYDLISVGQWLKEKTRNRQVYEYIAALSSLHMSISEPDLQPMGDFVRFMIMAKDIGMDLVSGSTGTAPRPGFVQVASRLAEVVCENGGEILLSTPVDEVVIEDKRAKGIIIRTKSGRQKIEADSVICTVPVKRIFKIMPERHFPADFVSNIKERFWDAGMLSGYVGLKRNIVEDRDVNPKSWVTVPAIIKAEEGYVGDVGVVMFMTSNWAPSRAPAGKHLWEFSIALLGEEMREERKVNRVIDETNAIMERNFCTWGKDMDWQLWTASEGFGPLPPIGERRPDVKWPWVDGLFFAGDSYGVRRWGTGIDAAVYSAILCADAVTGKDYSSQILPEYHR